MYFVILKELSQLSYSPRQGEILDLLLRSKWYFLIDAFLLSLKKCSQRSRGEDVNPLFL